MENSDGIITPLSKELLMELLESNTEVLLLYGKE